MSGSTKHPTDEGPIALADHGWFFAGGEYEPHEGGYLLRGAMLLERFVPQQQTQPYPVAPSSKYIRLNEYRKERRIAWIMTTGRAGSAAAARNARHTWRRAAGSRPHAAHAAAAGKDQPDRPARMGPLLLHVCLNHGSCWLIPVDCHAVRRRRTCRNTRAAGDSGPRSSRIARPRAPPPAGRIPSDGTGHVGRISVERGTYSTICPFGTAASRWTCTSGTTLAADRTHASASAAILRHGVIPPTRNRSRMVMSTARA